MRNITRPHKGNYLKHLLIVSAVTVPTLLIFIFFFVVPFGTEYKSVKKETKILERDLETVESNYKKEKHTLYNLEIGHKQIMSELKNFKSIDRFKTDNPYINNIESLKNKTEESKLFTKYVYQVTTKKLYSTLENFYDLMENSDDSKMRFVVNFPIIFEVAKKGKLKSYFNIDVFKLKPIKKEIVRPFKDIQK